MKFFRLASTEPSNLGPLRLARVGPLSDGWFLLQTLGEDEQFIARRRYTGDSIDQIMQSGGVIVLYRPRLQNLHIGDALDPRAIDGCGYGVLYPVDALPA